jgi:hypothetical protein
MYLNDEKPPISPKRMGGDQLWYDSYHNLQFVACRSLFTLFAAAPGGFPDEPTVYPTRHCANLPIWLKNIIGSNGTAYAHI